MSGSGMRLQVAAQAVVQELLALARRAGHERLRMIERDAHRRAGAGPAVVDAERLDEALLLGVERVDHQQVGRDQRADVRGQRLEHAIGIEVAGDLLADQAEPVQRRDRLLEDAHARRLGGGELLLQLVRALRGLGLVARLHRLHRLRRVARVLVLDRDLGLALEGQRPRQVAGLLPGARRLRQMPRARQAALRHRGQIGQQHDVVQGGRRRQEDGRRPAASPAGAARSAPPACGIACRGRAPARRRSGSGGARPRSRRAPPGSGLRRPWCAAAALRSGGPRPARARAGRPPARRRRCRRPGAPRPGGSARPPS